MTLDHIAIAVKDLDAALDLYIQTLGFKIAYRETITDQGIEAVGLQAGESIVELLRPLSDDSPVARYRGEAQTKLHHTAYRVDNLAAVLNALKQSGVRLIDEAPRKGAHGNLIAFIHPQSTQGVLIELCQRTTNSADY